jgi:hypothetical protein
MINAAICVIVGIRIEIQTPEDRALEGFGLKECVEFFEDEICHTVERKQRRRAPGVSLIP